jgi:hypothetical protein
MATTAQHYIIVAMPTSKFQGNGIFSFIFKISFGQTILFSAHIKAGYRRVRFL